MSHALTDAAPQDDAAIAALDIRALALKQAFDATFAALPNIDSVAMLDLLAIRVGADPYALSLADITGLFADTKITALPSPVPELLGIAGFRGALLPVYDLGALLGYERSTERRWLVTVDRGNIGLAFDRFDSYLRIAAAALAEQVHNDASGHVRGVVHAQRVVPLTHDIAGSQTVDQEAGTEQARPRPLLDVSSLVQAIRSRHRAAQL